MWEFILIGICIICLLELHTIITAKNKSLAIKELINRNAFIQLSFAPMSIMVIFVAAWVGCNLAARESTDVNSITVLIGFGWIIYGILMAIIIYVILGGIRWIRSKKDLEYYDWLKKIEKTGIIKYTKEEKVFIEKRDKEAKDKLIARFPFMRILWKKEVKNGTL